MVRAAHYQRGVAWMRDDGSTTVAAHGDGVPSDELLRQATAAGDVGEVQAGLAALFAGSEAPTVVDLPLPDGNVGGLLLQGAASDAGLDGGMIVAIADEMARLLRSAPTGTLAPRPDPGASIDRLLRTARQQFGMQLGLLGEFVEGFEVVRLSDGDAEAFALGPGDRLATEESYCYAVAQGSLGPAIPDVALEPKVADLDVTRRLRIGSYIGVPVTLPDGRLYGALWALSHDANPRLDRHAVDFFAALADLIGQVLGSKAGSDRADRRERIVAVLADGGSAHGLPARHAAADRQGRRVRGAGPVPHPSGSITTVMVLRGRRCRTRCRPGAPRGPQRPAGAARPPTRHEPRGQRVTGQPPATRGT